MKQYIVDAFTDRVFHGNQAVVCIMDDWVSEELMMDITRENNFPETSFVVKEGSKYHLRWFGRDGEMDLIGHATLACAYVLFRFYAGDSDEVVFTTVNGDLTVHRSGELLEIEFPAYELKRVPVTDEMTDALGVRPVEAYMGRDLLCVYVNEETVRSIIPNQDKAKALDGSMLHITAPGIDYDCVSRTFGPKYGVVEDPVCGSGHCHIAPYWAKRLGKENILAYQASQRGGILHCRSFGDRVFLSGQATLYSECEIYI